MSPLEIALSVFGLIFLAELPDKTSIAALVLATRFRPLPVFIGACLALTIQSLVALVAGALLAKLPHRGVHIGVGVLFIVSAIVMWRQHAETPKEGDQKKTPPTFFGVLRTSFLVIFLAEWGDTTQLATAGLVAHYNSPWAVVIGATLALWTVVGIAVTVGSHTAKYLPIQLVQRVAAVVFFALGLVFLSGRL